MTSEIAEAQKLSGIFQTFTTGRAVAPDIQDKCNAHMDALREELSNNRLKYLDYAIAFKSRKREIVRNDLSQHIVDVLFLVDEVRKPFRHEVVAANICAIYNTDKDEFFYVIKREIGHRIGAQSLTEDEYAYLTATVNVPVSSPERLGIELRELQTRVWYGDKQPGEGRGVRDLVVKYAKRVQGPSISAVANVTIGLVNHLRRKREAHEPL
ncbi:hypothetical protein CCR94_19845 [Rhodoblastus sphagnicola]|uniref:Uncharacterized protein n=1 Tax=Rhodoblastus sphagnicola TaxID=333368 RepID=A0A2S6MYQ8_9HYPH|nr:hypothetical protein [Rhodoblastus sphagnicola]MBB4196484.1 hypothetical protein [Rhodoblastus sphagnicola]PPQ27486.1 hypothetical protein CCR94_19845 [Rhodoblastus sphagnicola]